MNKIELDHFESLEELLITVKLWVKSEDPYDQVENRWFNTRELMEILEYTIKQKELIDKIKATTPLELAIMFHDTYEELAPKFNYETRKDTKEFDENSNNGKLMIAVCSKLLDLIKDYEEE